MLGNTQETVALRNVAALAEFQGSVWASCYGEGLFVYEKQGWRRVQGASRYITGLAIDAKSLWYCTWMEGEIGYVANKQVARLRLPTLLTPRFVFRNYCIAVDEKSVWVGSMGGLLRLEKGDNEAAPEWDLVIGTDGIGPSVITPFPGGAYFDGGSYFDGSGLWKIEIRADRLVVEKVQADIFVTGLAFDVDREVLWVSSPESLWRYYVKVNRLEHVVKILSGRGSELIQSILPTERGVYMAVGLPDLTTDARPPAKGGVVVWHREDGRWEWLDGIRVRNARCLVRHQGSLVVGGREGVQMVQDL